MYFKIQNLPLQAEAETRLLKSSGLSAGQLYVSGYEKTTHFVQFIDFELVVVSRVVEFSIALCCVLIAASVPEIRLLRIQNYARCLAGKRHLNMDFQSWHTSWVGCCVKHICLVLSTGRSTLTGNARLVYV